MEGWHLGRQAAQHSTAGGVERAAHRARWVGRQLFMLCGCRWGSSVGEGRCLLPLAHIAEAQAQSGGVGPHKGGASSNNSCHGTGPALPRGRSHRAGCGQEAACCTRHTKGPARARKPPRQQAPHAGRRRAQHSIAQPASTQGPWAGPGRVPLTVGATAVSSCRAWAARRYASKGRYAQGGQADAIWDTSRGTRSGGWSGRGCTRAMSSREVEASGWKRARWRPAPGMAATSFTWVRVDPDCTGVTGAIT
jgi:hypothetical protein